MKSNSSRSQPRGRAGGRAGGAGYDLQDTYVALQLVTLLVGGRDPPIEVIWEKKALDLGHDAEVEPIHVDDTILRLNSGKLVYVQIKEASPSGGWSVNQLVRSSVALQFWRQWTSKDPADRPGTLLRLASRSDMTTLELMQDVALRSRTSKELFSDDASSEIVEEISALAHALNVPKESPDLLAFLKCVQTERLPAASGLETRIIQSLAFFGEHAPDLMRRLIRIVGRSKHAGSDARSAFTKETLVIALQEDGFSEERLISGGIVRAKPIGDTVWDWYRDQIVGRFRTFRVYGLQVDQDVYADLPALFVPLRLAPIPISRERNVRKADQKEVPSLAERLTAEDERIQIDENDGRERPLHRGSALDLATVLSEKGRFAIIGGPGSGKTTTLKWLAITSALPGDEGRRIRLGFGLTGEPQIPVYVRFRQFADRVRARGLVGVEGRVGFVADFLTAELEAGLAGGTPTRDKALEMAQYLLESNKTLFLFDGLDEVADEGLRDKLFQAVADLMQKYKAPRVVVTSRPYAFKRARAPLDLVLFEPLPLDREGRRTFARQWYRAVRTTLATPLAETDARTGAEDLARAADLLSDLSEVPLLLSILALVHFNRKGLPVERATLYDNATLAMLGHWDRDPAGRDIGDDAVPTDWAHRLQLSEEQIRPIVEHLARRIQVEKGGGEFDRADAIEGLSEGLIHSTEKHGGDIRERAELLLRLLVDRAGILQERSPDEFAFVHLSFQEYLAARWYVERGESGYQGLVELASDEKQAEVCRLAVAIHAANQKPEVGDRAAALISSIGLRNPTLAAACLLEAPSVNLDKSYVERLARLVFSACTDPRGNHYPSHVVARLIWALLKKTPDSDRVLLEILCDSGDGFEREYFHPRGMRHRVGPRMHDFDDREFRHYRQHEMRFSPAIAVVAARPPGPMRPELEWVFQHLSSMGQNSLDGLFPWLAELLMIEAGKTPALNHIPALLNLLAKDDDHRRRLSIDEILFPRAESILIGLWDDEKTRPMVRNALVNSLSVESTREGGLSRDLAWRASQFLVARGERSMPELTDVIIRTGLYVRARHDDACNCLKMLASEPASRGATVKALKAGLANTDRDISSGCFRVLIDLGEVPAAYRDFASDGGALPIEWLSDPSTSREMIGVLAEDLWSEEQSKAWRAVKTLVISGNSAIPGVPHALVNVGLIAARSEAMDHIRQLFGNPALNVSVRGALHSGLTSSNSHIATAAGLLLLELEQTGIHRLLRRLIGAVFKDPDQIENVVQHLRHLVHDESVALVILEAISERLGDKPDRRVASRVARMLASEGFLGLRNLAGALVQHGLYFSSDHKEIAGYLERMLDDPDEVATARRALFEGLSSQEGEVAWGCACALWEAGSHVSSRIAQVLAGVGLRISDHREQAHAWLLELLARPRAANAARQSLEEAAAKALDPPYGHSRNLEHAWAIAECLLAAGALHADNLPEALIVGGLKVRDRHPEVLTAIASCIGANAEFAANAEEALWEALGDADTDVQWGAARALIQNDLLDERLIQEFADHERLSTNPSYDTDENIKALSPLLSG